DSTDPKSLPNRGVDTIVVIHDTTPPVVEQTISSDDRVRSTPGEIAVRVTDDYGLHTAQLRQDGLLVGAPIALGAATEATWAAFDGFSKEGLHLYRVLVTDRAGNETLSPQVVFVFDSTSPTATLS